MWCSRQNGKLMFYLGVMLVVVGLGLVVMKENVIGATLMCIGLFPLAIGFLVIVTHLRVDDRMGKKRKTRKIPEAPAVVQEEAESEKDATEKGKVQ